MSTFEYRKLLRASAMIKVVYRTIKEPVLQETVFSKNISCISMAVITTKELEKDRELLIEIYINEHKEPVAVKGKVVWQSKCSHVPKSQRQFYLTAIIFTDMSTDDAIRTSDFVREILRRHSEAENKRIIDMIEDARERQSK